MAPLYVMWVISVMWYLLKIENFGSNSIKDVANSVVKDKTEMCSNQAQSQIQINCIKFIANT